MSTLGLKPTHKAVAAYYQALGKFAKLGVKHEGAVSSAFEDLLEHCAKRSGRTLIPKYQLKRKNGQTIIPDAGVVDALSQVLWYGLWEAKDTGDDLDVEIKAKFKAGYPRDNILFQEPRRAVLYQNGECLLDADLTKPDELIHVLDLFFEWRPPAFDEWERAVDEFAARVPELGARVETDQGDRSLPVLGERSSQDGIGGLRTPLVTEGFVACLTRSDIQVTGFHDKLDIQDCANIHSGIPTNGNQIGCCGISNDAEPPTLSKDDGRIPCGRLYHSRGRDSGLNVCEECMLGLLSLRHAVVNRCIGARDESNATGELVSQLLSSEFKCFAQATVRGW
jgi:hypothetical protein